MVFHSANVGLEFCKLDWIGSSEVIFASLVGDNIKSLWYNIHGVVSNKYHMLVS